MSKNEVTKANNTQLATETAFDSFAGEGYGHQSATDFLIPRIAVLGDLSPQVKKNKEEFIEGAEVGDIADVAMGEILAKQGSTFPFLPVIRVKEVIEWKPRTQGGGIVSRVELHDTMENYVAKFADVRQNEKFEYLKPNGNELIETHQWYGIILNADLRWSFVPMKKSNLKVARKWMTKASSIKLPNGRQAPLFYKTYNLGSFLDSGNGNEWFNWKINDGPLLEKFSDNWREIFDSAVKLKEAVQSGQAKGDVRDNDDDNGDVM